MKSSSQVPLREQVSKYDCVPTTFLNALSLLFRRDEIPPLAIQRIFLHCLDNVAGKTRLGHGTTASAVRHLAGWLDRYETDTYVATWCYLSDSEVNLAEGGPVLGALKPKSTVLLRVTDGSSGWHYILVLRADKEWIYAFDPYPKNFRQVNKHQYQLLEPQGLHEPNVRIARAHLRAYSRNGRYRLGLKDDREAVRVSRR